MRCFVHREIEAFGTCRACNKGVCAGCAVDLGHSICCTGNCETKASALNAQLAQSMTVFRTQTRNRFIAPAFFVVTGTALAVYAGGGTFIFNAGTALGAIFVLFGIALAILTQRYARELQSEI